jgi:glycosyltransferase involved in cell wall biosynthesis
MRILWLTWKDQADPEAGGAELVNHELAKRLVDDGNTVHFLVRGYSNAPQDFIRDGYKVTTLGNKYTVYWEAYRYYRSHLIGWPDLVIDEVNTIPFLARFYTSSKQVLFVHQLCREIWFYHMPFPLNLIGYSLEPMYLRLLNHSSVITVSPSTKADLIRFGFYPDKIFCIPEATTLTPIPSIQEAGKFPQPTVVSLGAIRPMKRTLDVVKAFEAAKLKLPDLRLIIAGDASHPYGHIVLLRIYQSPFSESITYMGKVTEAEKHQLLRQAHVLCVTSIKEGWGLSVTEANSQGTPAIAYNVDGLRDSILHDETGLLCESRNPQSMAECIVALLNNKEHYTRLRTNAWQWSRSMTFEVTYNQFKSILFRL